MNDNLEPGVKFFNDEKETEFSLNIKEITNDIVRILIQKNNSYGNSFYEGLDEIKELYKNHNESELFKHIHQLSFYVREKDKLNRLKNLISTKMPKDKKDIAITDAVLDIVGYGILFLNYLKHEE